MAGDDVEAKKVLPGSAAAACKEYALPDSLSSPPNFLNTKPEGEAKAKPTESRNVKELKMTPENNVNEIAEGEAQAPGINPEWAAKLRNVGVVRGAKPTEREAGRSPEPRSPEGQEAKPRAQSGGMNLGGWTQSSIVLAVGLALAVGAGKVWAQPGFPSLEGQAAKPAERSYTLTPRSFDSAVERTQAGLTQTTDVLEAVVQVALRRASERMGERVERCKTAALRNGVDSREALRVCDYERGKNQQEVLGEMNQTRRAIGGKAWEGLRAEFRFLSLLAGNVFEPEAWRDYELGVWGGRDTEEGRQKMKAWIGELGEELVGLVRGGAGAKP